MGILARRARPATETVWQPVAACRTCERPITLSLSSGLWHPADRLDINDTAFCGHQPGGDPVEVAPVYAMDDDGAVGERAYGVTYLLESAPDARLTAWFYPATAGPAGGFIIGRRYEHVVTDYGTGESWEWSAYDVADDKGWYRDVAAADAGARQIAEVFAASPFTGDPVHSDGGFDWDGAPW